jgi:osmotically inducible protein OsmC
VPRITRTATAVWEGNVARGAGSLTADSSGAFELPFSLPSRIGSPEGKTSPEELLAAAHAGCLAMGLASELTTLGLPPERLEVECEILMDEVEGQGHQIVGSSLKVTVAAAVDVDVLAGALERADEGCPFSALLKRAGATVGVQFAGA